MIACSFSFVVHKTPLGDKKKLSPILYFVGGKTPLGDCLYFSRGETPLGDCLKENIIMFFSSTILFFAGGKTPLVDCLKENRTMFFRPLSCTVFDWSTSALNMALSFPDLYSVGLESKFADV